MRLINYFFALLFCLIYSSTCKPGSSQVPVPDSFSAIYCKTPVTFYDQKSIWESGEFKNATLEDRKKMLLNHFKQEQASSYKDTIYQSLPKLLWLLPIPVALYLGKDMIKGMSLLSIVGHIVVIAPYLDYPFRTLFTGIRDIYNVFMKMRMSNELDLSRIERIEQRYVVNKIDIAENYQTIIENRLVMAYCPNGGDLFSKMSSYEVNKNENTLAYILNIPPKTKEISYDQEKIDSALQGYTGSTLQDLKRLCIRHVTACRSKSVRKVAAYFHGFPGIGKTRAAKILAKVLDVELEVISLADITIDKLIGTGSTPGLLLGALANCYFSNALLLIDEADRVLLDDSRTELLSFILTLLDSETKTFYSPYLETEVDISHLGIILTGNSEITDQALKNRLHIIKFDGYDNTYKKAVVWEEFFPEQLALYEKAELSLTQEDFTEVDREMINKMVDEDTDKGFRSIKLKLMNYFEDKVLEKYFTKR